MEKRKAAIIFDNILLVVGVWLLSYLWTRYYVMNLLVALVAASGIAMCVIMLINLKRQRRKNQIKKQKLIDSIMNEFLYRGKEFTLDFLFSALTKKFEQTPIPDSTDKPDGTNKSGFENNPDAANKYENEFDATSKSDIEHNRYTVSKNDIGEQCDAKVVLVDSFILVKKTAVFPKFSALALNLEQLIECFVSAKKVYAKRIIILAPQGVDKLAKQGMSRLPDIKIEVFDKNKCYDFLGWLNSFPKITFFPKAIKPSLKKLIAGALAPQKFKQYLIISIVLMISSYFVMYSIYYITIASLTLTLAILSKINIVKKLEKR